MLCQWHKRLLLRHLYSCPGLSRTATFSSNDGQTRSADLCRRIKPRSVIKNGGVPLAELEGGLWAQESAADHGDYEYRAREVFCWRSNALPLMINTTEGVSGFCVCVCVCVQIQVWIAILNLMNIKLQKNFKTRLGFNWPTFSDLEVVNTCEHGWVAACDLLWNICDKFLQGQPYYYHCMLFKFCNKGFEIYST